MPAVIRRALLPALALLALAGPGLIPVYAAPPGAGPTASQTGGSISIDPASGNASTTFRVTGYNFPPFDQFAVTVGDSAGDVFDYTTPTGSSVVTADASGNFIVTFRPSTDFGGSVAGPWSMNACETAGGVCYASAFTITGTTAAAPVVIPQTNVSTVVVPLVGSQTCYDYYGNPVQASAAQTCSQAGLYATPASPVLLAPAQSLTQACVDAFGNSYQVALGQSCSAVGNVVAPASTVPIDPTTGLPLGSSSVVPANGCFDPTCGQGSPIGPNAPFGVDSNGVPLGGPFGGGQCFPGMQSC